MKPNITKGSLQRQRQRTRWPRKLNKKKSIKNFKIPLFLPLFEKIKANNKEKKQIGTQGKTTMLFQVIHSSIV